MSQPAQDLGPCIPASARRYRGNSHGRHIAAETRKTQAMKDYAMPADLIDLASLWPTGWPVEWAFGALGGLMIGAAAALYLLVNGSILGASGIIGGLVSGTAMRFWAERAAFLAGLVLVPAVIARIAQTRGTPLETNASSTWPLIVIAGLLVGLGTRLANGCTSGHGVCGISRLSPRGIAATAAYLGAGFVTMAIGRNLLGWF